MYQKEISVIGHKNPDTDSICSAIAYSYLKNILDSSNNYLPKRAGKINQETEFVLKKFSVELPKYIEDVYNRVYDIELKDVPSVNKKISMKNAYALMKENDAHTICITENDKLTGIITVGDIASSSLDVYDNKIVSRAKTPFSNIVETIEGTVLTGDINHNFTEGRVIIATSTPNSMTDNVEEDDLVVIGNSFEAQFFSIKNGAKCMIVCSKNPVDSSILEMAEQKNCIVVLTSYDAYTVARLINQSMPVEYFMNNKSLITFRQDDFTENVKEVMSKIRYSYFPVVGAQNEYLGLISKRSFINMDKKKVILVDHNEKGQAVEGIEGAEILEIVDHHRIGGLQTCNPVYFRNQPLGCTSTIIYKLYKENEIDIPPQIAGIMCASIISDTLMFRSPTCTSEDKNIAEKLAKIADINIEQFAEEMFGAGSDMSNKTIKEIFYQDYKTFSSNGITFGVSQITSPSKKQLEELEEEVCIFINDMFKGSGLNMVFCLLTNIIDQTSIVIFKGHGAKSLLQVAFEQEITDNTILLYNLVSRKKQFIPSLIRALEQ